MAHGLPESPRDSAEGIPGFPNHGEAICAAGNDARLMAAVTEAYDPYLLGLTNEPEPLTGRAIGHLRLASFR